MNPIDDYGPSPEYAHRLFGQIVDWYKTADLKAQIILGANGTFLTVLAGLALTKGTELRQIVEIFGVETWTFLSIMVVSLLGSFVAAIVSLHSRTMSHATAMSIFRDHQVDVSKGETYDPAVMWFFQLVARLNEEQFEKALKTIGANRELEIEALADQCILLAKNVVRKHRWINAGFALTAVTLSSLLMVTASYVVRVA